MIDLLVLSHASFMAINRHVYQLIKSDNYTIEIVIPKKLTFPNGVKNAEPKQENDPKLHLLNLIGSNPRTYEFENLTKVLELTKPKNILLDNDPVSFMANKVGKWANKNGAKVFCISCENLPLTIANNIKRRGIKNFPNILTKRFLINQNKNFINGVFCLNNDGVKIFKNEGFKNVTWMPLGFDSSVFYPNELAGIKIKDTLKINSYCLAYFGRIIREKGVHLLIEALASLTHLNWVLLMDKFEEYKTPYIDEIESLIKEKNLSERIIFFDANHYEIANYMNAANVVIVPSVTSTTWKEQYGRVAAESMACGKIVVASNSGALPDLLNGNGLIFQEGSVEDLTNTLANLITTNNMHHKTNIEIADDAKERLSIESQFKILRKHIFNK